MTTTERESRLDAPCLTCHRPGCDDPSHRPVPNALTRVDELAVFGFLIALGVSVAVVLVEVAL